MLGCILLVDYIKDIMNRNKKNTFKGANLLHEDKMVPRAGVEPARESLPEGF